MTQLVSQQSANRKIYCTFWRHLCIRKVNLGIVNRYEALAK